MSEFPEIFIFCDDASHGSRRTAVLKMRNVDGEWIELRPRAARRNRSVAVGLLDQGADTIFLVSSHGGTHVDPVTGEEVVDDGKGPYRFPSTDSDGLPLRHRFTLVCRRCGPRRGRTQVRGETLFPILDGWLAAGVLEIPLSAVAATLGRQQES